MFHDAARVAWFGERGTARPLGVSSVSLVTTPETANRTRAAGAAKFDWVAVTNTRRNPLRSLTSGTAPAYVCTLCVRYIPSIRRLSPAEEACTYPTVAVAFAPAATVTVWMPGLGSYCVPEAETVWAEMVYTPASRPVSVVVPVTFC